jgi:hypothetical protein
MRPTHVAAAVIALLGLALVPAGGAREQAAGCCYDAQVQGGFDRVTNSATLSWKIPYPDLVTTSVVIGTTIGASGYIDDEAAELAVAGTGPATIGTPTFSVEAYVYAQIHFRCVPQNPSKPDCGPIPLSAGATAVSIPFELDAPVAGDTTLSPNFTLSGSTDGTALGVVAGSAGSTAVVWVIPQYGFYDTVDFSATAPSGLSVALAPMSSRADTVATVTASSTTPPGAYTVTVNGSNSGLIRTDPITVDVTAQPPAPPPPPPPTTTAVATAKLTVHKAGAGKGTVSGAGVKCGTRCSATLPVGTAESLTAAAARGSRFTRWSGGCSGKKPRCSLVLSRSLTVTAVFAKK